jgi:hypothetical protein
MGELGLGSRERRRASNLAASALPGGGREFQVDFAVTEIEVIASILGIGFARYATLVCFRQFVAIRTLEPCRAPRGR